MNTRSTILCSVGLVVAGLYSISLKTTAGQTSPHPEPVYLFAGAEPPFRLFQISLSDGALSEVSTKMIGGRPNMPIANLLANTRVREHLRLSGEQGDKIDKTLDAIKRDQSELFARKQGYQFSELEQLCSEAENTLALLLNPQQLQEIVQLRNQFFIRREGLWPAINRPTIQNELKLSAEQIAQIKMDWQTKSKTLIEGSDRLRFKYFDQVMSILNPQQRDRLKPNSEDFLRKRVPPLSLLAWQLEHHECYSISLVDDVARHYRGLFINLQFQFAVDGTFTRMKTSPWDCLHEAKVEDRRKLQQDAEEVAFEGIIWLLTRPEIVDELSLTEDQVELFQEGLSRFLELNESSLEDLGNYDVQRAQKGLDPIFEANRKRRQDFCERGLTMVQTALVPHQRSQLVGLSRELEATHAGLVAALCHGLLGDLLEIDKEQKQKLLEIRNQTIKEINEYCRVAGTELWKPLRDNLDREQKKRLEQLFGPWLEEIPVNLERALKGLPK